MKEQILWAFRIILITFMFSTIIMFLMRKVAVHIGAMDVPRSEEGNRHIRSTAHIRPGRNPRRRETVPSEGAAAAHRRHVLLSVHHDPA